MRLEPDAFLRSVEAEPSVRFVLVLVDNGSREVTLALAERAPCHFEALAQRVNRGKARGAAHRLQRA